MAQNVTQGRNASQRRQRITMVDVARMAGVSVATVSAAFNRGSISPATYQRVMAVSKRTGYRPSRIARSMVTKKTHVLGLVIASIIPELTDSATACAHQLGYDLMALLTRDAGPGAERRCVERLLERMADGIILMPAQDGSVDYGQLIAEIRDAGTEVVAVDRYFREIRLDAVVTDNRQGARDATEHLINQGHSRIALLRTWEQNCSTQIDRLNGYRDALRRAGIPLDDDLIYDPPAWDQLNASIREFLTARTDLTAIFAAVDYLAYEVMSVCRDVGLRIPQDLSLVGFDDTVMSGRRFGELLHPRLTTVRQNFSQMANEATNLVVQQIENKTSTDDCKTHYLEPELIIRESTAPPARGKTDQTGHDT